MTSVLNGHSTWWRHQMETFSALLMTGESPSQWQVTRSFDIFFDLRLNKRLSKQSWGWLFETPSRSLWRHCNDLDWGYHGTTLVPYRDVILKDRRQLIHWNLVAQDSSDACNRSYHVIYKYYQCGKWQFERWRFRWTDFSALSQKHSKLYFSFASQSPS